MTRRRAVITLAFALTLAACFRGQPRAGPMIFPSRPVRIVFGFGPGSSGDVMSRVLAQRMSQDLGQPVIVEGKPGANGQLAAAQVARAPNDGYTLFLASVSNATNVAITPGSATDLAKELTPVALVATVPSILVVHPSLGVANVQELIALAKAKPDQLFFGSVGVGSPPHPRRRTVQGHGRRQAHARALRRRQRAGRDRPDCRTHFDGVLAGFDDRAAYRLRRRQGACGRKPAKRAGLFPDLPTIAEAGLPVLIPASGAGLMAPAGTPRAR